MSKKTARKPSDKRASAAAAPPPTTEERPFVGSKTPQVMRLVLDEGGENPVIMAGKSRIPKQLRGVQPLSRIMRLEAERISEGEKEELVTVNLTQTIISQNVPQILRRFNACTCEKCVAALSEIMTQRVPIRFVQVSQREADGGFPSMTEQTDPIRRAVISQAVRFLLGSKKRSFHDE